MSLSIHDFTVKICRQTLNSSKTADKQPYFYKAEEPDFKELTTDELNHLYLEALSIEVRLQNMLQMRG